MATQNAIDTNKPVGADDGGTGAATLTDHGVLVGSGTAAITPLSVGATGTLLVGAVGADPAFATSATGDFTFTSSTSGVARTLTVKNTDNSSLSSNARVDVSVGGGNAGDPQVGFEVNGIRNFYLYLDNSDSDNFNIGQTTSVSDFSSTVYGEITKVRTSAFLAQAAASHASNVTGDGTIYSYICETEIFDQSYDYNTTTGQFTAPVTGRYFFVANCRLSGVVAASAEEGAIYINTSNRRYRTGENRGTCLGDFEMNIATMADMDLGDVAYPQVSASGGAKTVTVLANTNPVLTCFAGYLAC